MTAGGVIFFVMVVVADAKVVMAHGMEVKSGHMVARLVKPGRVKAIVHRIAQQMWISEGGGSCFRGNVSQRAEDCQALEECAP